MRESQGDGRIQIDILIRSLGPGGAERQVAALAAGLSGRGHAVRVLTFYAGGINEQALRSAGVPVTALGKRGRWDFIGLGVGLAAAIAARTPDVLYAVMPAANVVAALARPWLKRAPIMMGVRASDMDLRRYDRLSRIVYACEARLSARADLIIANSRAGRRAVVARGFPEDRVRVVHNGIDTARFRPDAEAAARVRASLGLSAETPVVGMVARLDPMKDHATFLAAAANLNRADPSVHFILAGGGTDSAAPALRDGIERLRLGNRVIPLGERADIEAIYAAMDIASLSSAFGEGFPNAVGEAMACGIPCVATDVGDSAVVIGDAGRIVPSGNPVALADAWRELLNLRTQDRQRLGMAGRCRIVTEFSLDRMVEAIEAHALSLAGSPHSPRHAPAGDGG